MVGCFEMWVCRGAVLLLVYVCMMVMVVGFMVRIEWMVVLICVLLFGCRVLARSVYVCASLLLKRCWIALRVVLLRLLCR